jgi:hypothetical protein
MMNIDGAVGNCRRAMRSRSSTEKPEEEEEDWV